MPKVLIYLVQKIMWIFLFYDTDFYESRAHVHVGKKGAQKLCKIWLEPQIEVEKKGEFSDAQIKQIVQICNENRTKLLQQWNTFKNGNKVKTIKITK